MKKILIVDDNNDNIISLKFLLEKLSDKYKIITATNGEDALKKIEKVLPDAILLDIKMPIMDGYEVCRRIRNNKSQPYIPIIFLTAHDTDIQSRTKGYNLGADDYITKPFDANELFARLNSVLRIKFLQDELIKEKKILEKKVEERTKELIKSEQELKNFFNLSLDMICIGNINGYFKRINPAWEKVFGYTNEELLAKPFINFIHPEDKEKTIIQTKKLSAGNPIIDFENRFRCKDGSYKWLSWAAIPVVEKDLMYGIARDITEHKQIEQALQESEERYRRITETITDYIYTVCIKNGRPVETIHAPTCSAVTGYTIKEFKDNPYLWIEMVYEKDRNLVKEQAERTLAGEKIESIKHRIIRKDRSLRWVRNTYAPHYDSMGKLVSYDGLVQDITEHIHAREEIDRARLHLMHAEKMASLGILVSGIAHEINNPNNFIMLNSNIIKRIWNDMIPIVDKYYERNKNFMIRGLPYSEVKEEMKHIFSGLIEGANRIKNIVHSLREFSQPDIGKWNQRIDVNSAVKSSVVIMNNFIRESTDNFVVEYGKNIPKIIGNFQQLEQVIINLITNSCKALKNKNKKITISTFFDDKKNIIIIKIADQGIGIPPENLDKIMNPFFSTRLDIGGTGLGLSISYNIIKKFNGEIEFKSEVEKGTTVIVSLPVSREQLKIRNWQLKT